ncbi:hypothetical protein BGZ94_005457, partial [Podila epigama]
MAHYSYTVTIAVLAALLILSLHTHATTIHSKYSPYPSTRRLPPHNHRTLSRHTLQKRKPGSPQSKAPHTHLHHRNLAAETLKLVQVPLKTSCEILRAFYNLTHGTNWSNQDGWQYVDSVTIPGRRGGRVHRGHLTTRDTHHEPSSPSPLLFEEAAIPIDSDNDNSAQSMEDSEALSSMSKASIKGRADDGGPETHPDTHPDTMPRPPEDDSNDGGGGHHSHNGRNSPGKGDGGRIRGGGGGAGDYGMPGTNPSTELDIDNCCGWYGVVCIGPDGEFPPHWPPYDEDLISSRVSAPSKDSRLDHEPSLKSLLAKRKEPPYHSYHDRQWHRHHLGGGRKDQDGDDGYYDGKTGDEGGHEHRPTRKPHHDPGTDHSKGDQSNGWGPLQEMDDWYIIELHLGFNGLVGPVPEILSQLVNLIILDLSNNELEGEIPLSLSNLTRLERLDLSSNKITGSFPVAVTMMLNLQELVLRNNYFAGHLLPDIMKLKQLTELSIANNEFDGLMPPGLFAALRKLKVVNINQNAFTGEISPEVGGLPGLLKFSARANEFTGRIPKELGNCKRLTSINLGDNHLTGELPESIYGLENLRVLELPGNKLIGPISPKIGNMTNLTRLVLSHNEFNGTLPGTFQNLSRLEFMVVNYNRFDGIFPSENAPSKLAFCLVQPNAFQHCPSNETVDNPSTLAYRCNLDCS